MSGREWTEDQLAAITDLDHDLLVSAAAGSGKTAVLAERVLRLIREPGPDGNGPVELERMLIITFTRKAAREMRERIEKSILAGLREDGGSGALRAALEALPRANIQTLDSFCDRLVRAHFHQAGIAPDTRIADEEELREINAQAVREVFEELAGADPDTSDAESRDAAAGFTRLLTSTPPSRGRRHAAEALAARIGTLRTFIESLDDPDAWILRVGTELRAALAADRLEDLPEAGRFAGALADSLDDLREELADVIARAAGAGGEQGTLDRWSSLAREIGFRAAALRAEGASRISTAVTDLAAWFADNDCGLGLSKLQNKKECGDALYAAKEFNAAVLKRFSDGVKRWTKIWLAPSPGQRLDAARIAAENGLALLDLARRAEERATRIKRERAAAGFADIERRALNLLVDRQTGPTSVAHECREGFAHVLVDEYQDISPLQDAIIRAVSHVDDPSPGVSRNLFIVGDLKQSIYRFRRAEPGLFGGRLRSYGTGAAGETTRRIDLSMNFRSRPGVLAFANEVFAALFDERVGEIEYGERTRLNPHRTDEPESAPGFDPVAVEAHWLAKTDGDADADEERGSEETDAGEDGEDGEGSDPVAEISGVRREARFIARRIHAMCDPETGVRIPDGAGGTRTARPGDCAIILRSIARTASDWIDAFAREGLRLSASSRRGLLEEAGVTDVMSALKAADYPFEDIALVSLMRSAMFGFSDDDLLRVRMTLRAGPMHRAVWVAAGRGGSSGLKEDTDCAMEAGTETGADSSPAEVLPAGLRGRLASFLSVLDGWRERAVRGEAFDLLEAILRETRYEAHLGGLPDALPRLRSLDEFREVVRSHARRGPGSTGRLLRALERAGPAAEDDEAGSDDIGCVRLITVHKSKGLEFPVVFLPRLFSPYRDGADDDLLTDSKDGMAMHAVDAARRLRMIPPSHAALAEGERRRARSEELRLLYVGMTRARERLILVGSPPRKGGAEKVEPVWLMRAPAEEGATALARLRARSPGDLIAPIVTRMHRRGSPPWLRVGWHAGEDSAPRRIELPALHAALASDSDREWELARGEFAKLTGAGPGDAPPPPVPVFLREYGPGARERGAPLKLHASSLRRDAKRRGLVALRERLYAKEAGAFAEEAGVARESLPRAAPVRETVIRGPMIRGGRLEPAAPDFVLSALTAEGSGEAAARADAALRGTRTHRLLASVDLRGDLTPGGLRAQARALAANGVLGEGADDEALEELPWDSLDWFFDSDMGYRMIERPGAVLRELPFTRHVNAGHIHHRLPDGRLAPLASGHEPRMILLQGVIDCVIDDGDAVTILDYKTDRVRDEADIGRLCEHYHAQIDAYRRAIREIWRVEVREALLVFLDARRIIPVED